MSMEGMLPQKLLENLEPARQAPSVRYDTDLLLRLKKRDAAAQLAVWKKELKYLRYIAASILISESDTESLVADAFCDFFFHYVDTLQNANAIKAYLRIVVVRRVRRTRQRANRFISMLEEQEYLIQSDTFGITQQVDYKIWNHWLENWQSSNHAPAWFSN